MATKESLTRSAIGAFAGAMAWYCLSGSGCFTRMLGKEDRRQMAQQVLDSRPVGLLYASAAGTWAENLELRHELCSEEFLSGMVANSRANLSRVGFERVVCYLPNGTYYSRELR